MPRPASHPSATGYPGKLFFGSDGICPTHWRKMTRMNEKQIATIEQLELSLDGALPAATPRRESRMARAAWWFGQMRRLVSAAIDWQAAPEPRPEQPWLELSHQRQSA